MNYERLNSWISVFFRFSNTHTRAESKAESKATSSWCWMYYDVSRTNSIEISSKSRVRVDLRALLRSLLPMRRPSREHWTEGKMIETVWPKAYSWRVDQMDGLWWCILNGKKQMDVLRVGEMRSWSQILVTDNSNWYHVLQGMYIMYVVSKYILPGW